MEACKIVITKEHTGLVNVSAPMKYKDLCYEILSDAEFIINREPDRTFLVVGGMPTIIITMNMTGLVDVAAPLPNKEICLHLLKAARKVIEEFESNENKLVKSGFADSI